ncbi:hypothetical protein TRL7639_00498 [Falsiruegeria litorea R37]|uniref:Asp/Glu/Hydantoin racemase n=1 Tax=Falsiruegeria litorea R37 TaxID=1200284 RepID=A0A1Y5RQU4_9RHOB|nr:hypothetical protein [Falsiruegeria litorea]SLN20345.1 hypothetical protein TRL7639_00498 [Falsiruegeria litorea R37]
MTDLTLFHTAHVHRDTFDTLAERLAPNAKLAHVIRPDWLERAQGGIDVALSDEIQAEIALAPNALCTCTSIAQVAVDAGALRIDRPMMDAAAATRGPVLMAYCLDSTLEPSSALLTQAFLDAGLAPNIHPFPLRDLWNLFETGQAEEFAEQIANRIDSNLCLHPEITCVVLAQASMAQASHYVTTPVPVLSSPELALRQALGLPSTG